METIVGVTVKLHHVDLETEDVTGPVTVRVSLTDTVNELMTEIIKHFPSACRDKMRCVRDRYQVLREPDKTLKEEGFHKSTNVFFECSGTQEDNNSFFRDTKFFRIIDDFGNRINIVISIPTPDEVEKFLSSESSMLATPSPDVTLHQSPRAPLPSAHDKSIPSPDQEPDGVAPESSEHTSSSSPLIINRMGPSGDSSSQMHSFIGEAVFKENQDKEDDFPDSPSKSAESISTPSSVSAAASESPQLESTMQTSLETEPVEPAENWDLDDNGDSQQAEKKKFFEAKQIVDSQSGKHELAACLDRTITLTLLKKELEPFMNTTGNNFKIFRVYGNSQEMEITRHSETLATSANDSRLIVRLGRALKPGEQLVKIHQLLIHEEEPCKFLTDVVLAKGMSVLTAKKIIVKELRKRGLLDVPLDRCRLRKYSWKTPTTIYLDTQVFDEDIHMYVSNLELFVEALEAPERKKIKSHLSVYVRRWKPSTFELSPFQEIVLDKKDGVEGLKKEVSDVSGIHTDNIELAKPSGSFPCITSLLEIHDKLEWNSQVSSLYSWPICEDGCVLFYRDKEEELVEPSEEQKKEIQQQDNIRLAKFSSKTSYYSRKERPLKIYTEETPTKNPSSISFSPPVSQSSPCPSLQHPELD